MQHGIPMNEYSLAWGVGTPLAYFALCGFFRALNLFPGKARRGSNLNDIAAFEILAGLSVMYLASAGCYVYFNINDNGIYSDLAVEPIYTASDFVQNHLAIPMMFFQGWNLLLCLCSKDLNDPMMIVHHFLVTILAYFGLHPYIHYHASFFFGVAEMTNIPLTVIDAFKYFPSLKKNFPAVNEAMRVVFALLFIALRLLLWPYKCYSFWLSSAVLIAKHYTAEASLITLVHTINQAIEPITTPLLQTSSLIVLPIVPAPCHSLFVVGFFVIANLLLTFLQFFWGFTIFGFLFAKPKISTTKKD